MHWFGERKVVWSLYSILGKSTLLYIYIDIGPVVYLMLRAFLINVMSFLICSLPGMMIEDSERWIPRILIGSFFGFSWISVELRRMFFCFSLEFIVMSLVFVGLARILLKFKNCVVILRRVCKFVLLVDNKFKSSMKAILLIVLNGLFLI
jgi:hypothetical protein